MLTHDPDVAILISSRRAGVRAKMSIIILISYDLYTQATSIALPGIPTEEGLILYIIPMPTTSARRPF